MAVKSVDRLAVLDEGMTFHPIAITPQEMQIIETQALLYRRGGAYVQYCTAQNKSSSTID
jgi:hypothetical protein